MRVLGVEQWDPEYVKARRILLDALQGLGVHRKSVILVGAQALYLQVGQGELAVAPYTLDGDLAIDRASLDDEPTLGEAMEAAGFALALRPGTWSKAGVPIDLLVPASLGGRGRRSADLGPHGREVARKASGLEAVVADHSLVRVGALESSDERRFDIRIAGLAVLLVAKLHKIDDRKSAPSRQQDKDALDVLRLLQAADLAQLGAKLLNLSAHRVAGEATRNARELLWAHFASRRGVGVEMAVRASRLLEDEETIALSCETLARRLLEHWL